MKLCNEPWRSSPGRVAMYTPNYPGVSTEGGIGTHIQTLGRGLTELGHHVAVLTPGTGPASHDGRMSLEFASTRHIPVLDRFFPGAGACVRVYRSIKRIVREQQIDIIEFPNWEGLGLLVQKLSFRPTVVRLYTSSKETQVIDNLESTRARRFDVLRERWQAHRACTLVTHSNAHRDLMADELQLASDRIQLIPLGIPVYQDFQRQERDDSPPTVVYLGRLEKRKGTPDLLHAIPQVLGKCPGTRFVLIGSDRAHCPRNRTHAQYLADEFPAEVRSQVQFLGRLPQPEVDRWLQTADVFVAPSLYESFGLIFPEAMRWGTPVIGTRVGGIPEIVTDGETGLLVEAQNPAELAGAMVRLLTNNDLRQRLGNAGRKHVETNFTVEKMARATAELYAEVLAKQGKRATTVRV
jgi:glycogen(starch) synthase